ncbi:MAG: multifunctional CCA addition/repair protein [Gammaproteobacteria bacterium]|nr:multifunctional CCA addition/repair protein [Gammaproteobacteria bacterium]
MEVYLVGGAVRDELLGREVKDRDWVVVGATPRDMIDRGYKPVGRDFPVFLHPETREEYALARKERKTGPGYTGFAFEFSPDVSLEDDLVRRDLTINAMARDRDGALVDYFGGRQDLEAGVLRHVSPAFTEDPVRLLRTARFRARYGFRIAADTMELLSSMVARGEVDALVAERVWQELAGALVEPRPELFIETLRECGALARIFPEIDQLFGVPQRRDYHPEIDTGVHTLMALARARALTDDPVVLFAVLVHDLGKAVTPQEEWPSHHRHEILGVEPVERLCKRYRAPTRYRDFARQVSRYHLHMHRLPKLKPKTIVDLLEALGGFRDAERINQFALACQADAQGRKGLEDAPYPQANLFRRCFEAAAGVNAREIAERHREGKQIGEALHRERCAAVKSVLSQYRGEE